MLGLVVFAPLTFVLLLLIVAQVTVDAVNPVTLYRNSYTVAGRYGGGGGSIDGPTTIATLSGPSGICPSPTYPGVFYVADNELIRVLNGTTLTTLFGIAGVSGTSDGDSSTALLNGVATISCNAGDGYIYIAEPFSNVIRRFNDTWLETFSGLLDNGPGMQDGDRFTAMFDNPSSLAFLPSIFASDTIPSYLVADLNNNALRRVLLSDGSATTVLTLNAPFYITASTSSGIAYVLYRPSSSTIGVYKFFANNGSGGVWNSIGSTPDFVAVGVDSVLERWFAATSTRVYELFDVNRSTSLIAGSGNSYVDGSDPRFNFIQGMFVSSFRSIFLACGPLAYVIRRLAFDPAPPISVTIAFADPFLFPLDNVTALTPILAILQSLANAMLGTGSTLELGLDSATVVNASSVRYNTSTRTTFITLTVPNNTYTGATQTQLQNGDFSQVLNATSAYYSLTNVSVLLDLLQFPFLFDARDGSQTAAARSVLESQLQNIFGFGYLFIAPSPSIIVNTTDGSQLAAWKLLLPASFQNASTMATLESSLGALRTTMNNYSWSQYFTGISFSSDLTGQTIADIPTYNATAMNDIRKILQQNAQNVFGFPGVGISTVQCWPSNGSCSATLLLPTSFDPASNATTRQLISSGALNMTAVVQPQLDAFYGPVIPLSFDQTAFPWGDSVAVAAIRSLILDSMNAALASTSNVSNTVSVQRKLGSNPTECWFDIWIPSALLNMTGANPAVVGGLSKAQSAVKAFINAYYQASAAAYRVPFSALRLPIFNCTAMDTLRRSVAAEVGALIGYSNVGANTTLPSYPCSSNVSEIDSQIRLGGTDTASFPLFLPLAFVNQTTTQLLSAFAFPNTLALAASMMPQSFNFTVDGTTFPVGNATAMEAIRWLLTTEVRAALNTTFPGINIVPAVLTSVAGAAPGTYTSTLTYQVEIPEGVLDPNLNVSAVVVAMIRNLTSGSSSILSDFLNTYYADGFTVTLPYDITPWSNSTTMSAVLLLLSQDCKAALSAAGYNATCVMSTDGVRVNRTSKNVTFAVRLPPVFRSPSLNASAASILAAASLLATKAFLDDYFPKHLRVSWDGSKLPWSDPSAMATIINLIDDYLADSVFMFANVGVNATTYSATSSGNVTSKVIVPPSFDNATTWNLLAALNGSDPTAILSVAHFIASYYPQDYFATFAAGDLPVDNATAMQTIQQLLLRDVKDLFQFENVGVGSFSNVVDNVTGAAYTQFPLMLPPSFANSSTVSLLIAANYPRVRAFLAQYYATPAPPTPAPAFAYSISWAIDSMPTSNSTQMELLREALVRDVQNTLNFGNISIAPWITSQDGTQATYVASLPITFNNITTAQLLGDTANYPIFQALLASFTQGNLVNVGSLTAATSEGCSRGCVIAVAAVGAVIVTGCVVAAIVITSKRKRTATLVAPKFSPVFDESSAVQRTANKNPLELA